MNKEYKIVYITRLRPGVNDREGLTIQAALNGNLGYKGVEIRVGRQYTVILSAGNMADARRSAILISKENTKLCNPVLENVEIRLRQLPKGSFRTII